MIYYIQYASGDRQIFFSFDSLISALNQVIDRDEKDNVVGYGRYYL